MHWSQKTKDEAEILLTENDGNLRKSLLT